LIQLYERRQYSDFGEVECLTHICFNGKSSNTIDELRQRRLDYRIYEKSDDEVLNQENLDEGFFFAVGTHCAIECFSLSVYVKTKGHDKDAWQVVANSESQAAA